LRRRNNRVGGVEVDQLELRNAAQECLVGGHGHAVEADGAHSPRAALPQRFDDERHGIELPVPLFDPRQRAGFNDLPLEGEKAADVVFE